jgi:glucuronate isomerase
MFMSHELRQRLYAELSAVELIDPHTHINAHQPASRTLADILGYHYYTELAHSAGLARESIEEPGLDPKEKVARLIAWMEPLQNTIQYSWLIEMAQTLFGWEAERVTLDNWESLYDAAQRSMNAKDWPETVLRRSKLGGVFLTNDFDDPLEGFNTRVYIPCLRTDDLVFHFGRRAVRERLHRCSGVDAGDAQSLRAAIGQRFEHFVGRGARACAISLPPDFQPEPVSDAAAAAALTRLAAGDTAGGEVAPSKAHDEDRQVAAQFAFWTLAQFCAEFQLPFDLMIGVHRGVYEAGVFQGQDLYDSRVSLIQYRRLFNAFPQVTFPISVLASVTNQELTSYAWIFPNVVTNGHWWYSNTPTFIEHDAAARLEAVPQTKQIGYYSDMYKLEFALPKFNMYRRILAKVLAERFVIDRGWSETRALQLGLTVLRDNTERIFAGVPSGKARRPEAL